ncbi:hypothetical protein AAP_02571 [Ascosphaera apis ARSEF 7405]|uniref:DUF4604 domain-containing protein n=1 Tax=Ascosphaera apis ARSEF 7405 TaxID=392613 RepID=A0A167ZUF5_9EURO|nr:hypothetical protein AAP_02571 [Ascosphaera apis ARSEF 7405]
MSFNSKNLHYDKNEPSFLKKLRSQYGSGNSALDRRNPVNRPGAAKRLLNDPDEDEPTYVDEESNEVISREEYQSMLKGEEGGQEKGGGEGKEGAEQGQSQGSERSKAQLTAEIGGVKRKKQAKIIGGDDGESDDDEKKKKKKSTNEGATAETKGNLENDDKPAMKKVQQKKKQKKKIKLSYDADEDDNEG